SHFSLYCSFFSTLRHPPRPTLFPYTTLFRSMVTLHEVITFLVSMQISISSLQTHNVNRCGRSRHLARKLSLRRKRSSPNVSVAEIGRAVQQECRDRSRMPSSA